MDRRKEHKMTSQVPVNNMHFSNKKTRMVHIRSKFYHLKT